MENEKKNNGLLVGILIGIIITLLIGGCLFATGTIGFKTSTTNNNGKANENNQTNITSNDTDINSTNNVKDDTSPIVGYYRTGYEVTQNQFTIIEFQLKSDKTVNYVIGSSHNIDNTDAEIVMEYSGTYTEDGKDVMLSIEATDKNCTDGKYSCKNSIKLWKNTESNSLIEYREDAPEYFKVDKTVLIK